MKRRDLLQVLGASWLVDQVAPDRSPIRGRIVGAAHKIGHKLRKTTHQVDDPVVERRDLVIVGSGVSGLSAAWRMASWNLDTLVLELESSAGGTSTWGTDGVVPHPWGAHYLPIPERGAVAVERLLADVGVLTGWDAAGQPQFAEHHLCHTPEERLFYQGSWHPSLVPFGALDATERAEIERFQALYSDLTEVKGNDGREAFAIPSALSSRDPRFLELDHISMDRWLTDNGFSTAFVRWYAEYATRDDYGASLSETSAWAGLHYYAARKRETDQTSGSRFLVWPEGNGWLLKQLLETLPIERRHGALALSVQPSTNHRGVAIHYYDSARDAVRVVEARGVVLAIPAFIAARLMTAAAQLPVRAASPWLVANLHVNGAQSEPGRPWDSILHGAEGLGYVDASHQLPGVPDRTVLTYFRAFGDADVSATRRHLLQHGWTHHASEVLLDLTSAHPDLIDRTSKLDVMLWGHAMPRPRPGFLGSNPFEGTPVLLNERVAWAHVDQSGFAIFEEANYRGVAAAEALAAKLGINAGESWLA